MSAEACPKGDQTWTCAGTVPDLTYMTYEVDPVELESFSDTVRTHARVHQARGAQRVPLEVAGEYRE
jgi:hypothetical protein